MGGDSVCTGKLVGTQRVKNILSFGEDEDGELYILATAFASPTSPQGVVYQIIDPARSVRPHTRLWPIFNKTKIQLQVAKCCHEFRLCTCIPILCL